MLRLYLFFILIKQPPLRDYVSYNCQLQHILGAFFFSSELLDSPCADSRELLIEKIQEIFASQSSAL